MTKYKVNGGDKSDRGDKVISPEAERNPLRDKRERRMDMYGNVRSCLGTRLGVRITDPNTVLLSASMDRPESVPTRVGLLLLLCSMRRSIE